VQRGSEAFNGMFDRIVLIQFLRLYGKQALHRLDVSNYPWELLIRQARHANLLSRVAVLLQESDLLNRLPEKPRLHFCNAMRLAEANARSSNWEVRQVYDALHTADIEFLLLKGAAYIWLQNDAAKGRLFSDTDIMVEKVHLELAERSLARKAWFGDSYDRYKQRYYRKWMHEIPPLRHIQRQTTLDVHHTILPPTSRLKPKPMQLWDSAVPVEQMPGLFTLSPIDMILHSATHLFHEGEFGQGLRDISDLDLLLRQYIVANDDWSSLLRRSIELNLERPLFYALNYAAQILHTPISKSTITEAGRLARLNPMQRRWMDALFLRALAPSHSSCRVKGYGLACWLLYIRSHWLRMPVHLLIPHLFRKSWMRLTGKDNH